MWNKIKFYQLCIICSVVLLKYNCGFSFQFSDQPINNNIRIGKLPNGFTYYIKPTQGASQTLEMRLVVKVGHQNENSDQYQFGHLLEHIATSEGRDRYSPMLDKKGIPFNNLTASVRFDHTIYRMTIPGGKQDISKFVLPFFKQKLNLELGIDRIEREKTTVLNESYSSQRDNFLLINDLELDMTGLASLHPQDLSTHLYNIKADSLIHFYGKWYRPDLTALIIVGDIDDIDQIESDIRKYFNDTLSKYKVVNQEIMPHNYLSRKPSFLKEAQSGKVIAGTKLKNTLIRFYKRQKINDKGNFTQNIENELIRKLLISMLTKRFNAKQEEYKTSYHILPRFLDPPKAFILNISNYGNRDREVIENSFKALKEVEYFGFSSQEFNENKEDLLRHIKNIETTTSSYWANEIVQHYVRNDTLLSNKEEIRENLLKMMTVSQFNREIKSYVGGVPEDIIIVADPEDSIFSISESTIRGWISEIDTHSIKQYKSPKIPTFLLDSVTSNGLNNREYTIEKASIPGANQYVLQNGLRIILKSYPVNHSLTPNNNQIFFQGIVKKGLNCFPEKDYFSALNSPSIVINSGVGELNKFELARYLKSKEFEGRVFPYIDSYDSGIKGTINLKELETALQLIYLYLTSPNFNKLAFEDWKFESMYNSQYKDLNREDFESYIKESIGYDEFLLTGTRAVKGLSETDFNKARAIYSQLFQNPKDFTFMFTGDFPEREVLNLCRKYLGNILNFKGNSFTCQQDLTRNDTFTKSIRKKIPSTQPMDLSMVRISYVSPIENSGLNWKEQIKTEILRRSMTSLIMERLRFKTGLIYQSSGGVAYDKINSLLEVFIGYECLPENVEESILISKNLRNFLITEPISEVLFDEVIVSMLRSIGEFDSYRSIIKEMYKSYMFQEALVKNSEKREFIQSLTPQDLLKTAQKYLSNEPYEFIMSPN